MRVGLVAIVVGLALWAAPLRCAAQDETRLRLDAVETIHEGEAPAERWWWTWVSIHVALVAGQLTWAALTDDEATRVDRLTGATSAALGTAMLLIFAPPAMGAPQDLAEHPEDAVPIVQRCAHAQRRARSVLAHLLVIGWAIASGLFLWLGFDRPVSGALQAGSVLLIGEMRILTHPTHARQRAEAW